MRVNEVFLSVQGEGTKVGYPSVFVRLFGCNFRCPGFGMPLGQESHEADELAKNIDSYKTINDVPLVKTGCDSFLAWHPAFKKFSPDLSNIELMDKIRNVCNGDVEGYHLVITGGEPLLKPNQQKLISFFEDNYNELKEMESLTFETNGTQELTKPFVSYLNDWFYLPVSFSISPKLKCSGVSREKAIRKDVITQYKNDVKTEDLYLKFVVSGEQDLNEVNEVLDALDFHDKVYIMPVGGTYEEYKSIAPKIADLAIKFKYLYSPRLHVDLYRNQWAK